MSEAWPSWKPRWTSPVCHWDACSPARRRDLTAAWHSGELYWKLNPNQLEAYQQMRAWEVKPKAGRTFLLDISRRWGKSSAMLLMAFEDALRNPRWRIPYVAPTYKMVEEILLPLVDELTQDCPGGGGQNTALWTYERSKTTFRFKNGSVIKLVGLDVNPDGARGQWLDKYYGDECGFFANLEYVIKSVLTPQMQKRPHARGIIGSTPPVTPSHYWSAELVPIHIATGNYIKRTIEDNPMLSDDEREEFIEEAGGRKSVFCRREYFAEHIADANLAVIPEFQDKEEEIVKAVDAPAWRDCYVSLDPGWKDLTALLFGYNWFERRTLVVEDEIAMPMANSEDIAQVTKAKEKLLWGGIHRYSKSSSTGLRQQPYMRYSDVKPETVNDLWQYHKLAFSQTKKDNLDDQVNAVRIAIMQGRILIHPRCVKLIRQLKTAVWRNLARKTFAQEGKDFGHFDLVAALIYMYRNINWTRNPYPPRDIYVAGVKTKASPGVSSSNSWGGGKGPTQWKRGSRRFGS